MLYQKELKLNKYQEENKMEQKYKNIQITKEFCYKQIKEAETTLEELRKSCDHPEEFHEIVTYSPRPGQYWEDTTICSICGEIVKCAVLDAIITEVTVSRND